MPFDPATVAVFFKAGATGVIGFEDRTYAKLVVEGIQLPEDLIDFTKEGLETIFDNFRRPGKVKVPKDDDEKAKKEAGTPYKSVLKEVGAYTFSAKSKMRLMVAMRAAKYYDAVDRPLTPESMTWKILRNFEVQYDSITTRMENDDKTDVPRLERGTNVPKWLKSFEIYLRDWYGVRRMALLYVIRDLPDAAAPPPALAEHQPHSHFQR